MTSIRRKILTVRTESISGTRCSPDLGRQNHWGVGVGESSSRCFVDQYSFHPQDFGRKSDLGAVKDAAQALTGICRWFGSGAALQVAVVNPQCEEAVVCAASLLAVFFLGITLVDWRRPSQVLNIEWLNNLLSY